MAIKKDRTHVDSNISFFSDSTMERGGIATMKTAGSGVAMDDSSAVVEYAADPSGKAPVGILMNEVVNLDLTRQKQNIHRDEVQVNGKVTLWSKGTVVTDMIYPGETISAGDKAYLVGSGLLTASYVNDDATPLVGRFLSTKDAEGYAKVQVNLP